MSVTKGGIWQTPTNTPIGQPMQVSVDNPYITKDQFIEHPIAMGLGITASSEIYTNGALDRLILQASSWINRYTNRHFDRQTIDEIYSNVSIQVENPKLTVIPLQEGPINQVNTAYIQVLQWFIQFDLGYMILHPLEQYYQIVPLLSSSGNTGSPIPSVLLEKSSLGLIWTNYDYGYSLEVTGDTGEADAEFTVYTFTNPLWVLSTGVSVYVNDVLISASDYTVNYRDGTVTFTTPLLAENVVTADYWTYNGALPQDIVDATTLKVAQLVAFFNNPLGVTSFKTGNTAWTWGDDEKNPTISEIKRMLAPWRNQYLSIT